MAPETAAATGQARSLVCGLPAECPRWDTAVAEISLFPIRKVRYVETIIREVYVFDVYDYAEPESVATAWSDGGEPAFNDNVSHPYGLEAAVFDAPISDTNADDTDWGDGSELVSSARGAAEDHTVPLATVTGGIRPPEVTTNSGDEVGPIDVWGEPIEYPGIDPNPGGGGGGGESGGGGGGGDSGGGAQTDGLPPEPDCAPDDQARQALELFKEDAARMGEFFGERERSFFIISNDDGSMSLANFNVGPSVFSAEGAQTTADSIGLIPANIIGYIHNHPSSPTISGPDRDIILAYQNYINDNGGTQEFRLYNITSDETIRVYDRDNLLDPEGVDVTEDC